MEIKKKSWYLIKWHENEIIKTHSKRELVDLLGTKLKRNKIKNAKINLLGLLMIMIH